MCYIEYMLTDYISDQVLTTTGYVCYMIDVLLLLVFLRQYYLLAATAEPKNIKYMI